MSQPLGLVLLTALPPTLGHTALIRFGAQYMQSVGGELIVLLCVLPDEPPGRDEHLRALEGSLADLWNVKFRIQFSNDPQGPSGPDDDEFWSHWVRVVLKHTREEPSYVFSSEPYGDRLATSLRAQHVTYDLGRTVTSARATDVRRSPLLHFHHLAPALRTQLRRRVCIFGPESTGKTTLAKSLAAAESSVFCPEWARPYLEQKPSPETTMERMDVILRGQAAQERAADFVAEDQRSPFVFLDTDLLSTWGFWDVYFGSRYPETRKGTDYRADLERLWRPADLYLVTSDSIPFTPDPLRYGGTERETSTEYWAALARSHRLNVHVMRSGSDRDEQFAEALHVCQDLFDERAGFVGYERAR